MDRLKLQHVLETQRADTERWSLRSLCARRELSLFDFVSKRAKVVIGVRRSGKSTLCQQALLARKKPFAYINFDVPGLVGLRGEDLEMLQEVFTAVYGKVDTVFLDELQNIPEWFLFVNTLLRQGYQVVVTGSNAKLLSGELATHLTGRHRAIELFPFSFLEACTFKKVDLGMSTQARGERRAAFDRYLQEGGFPEIVEGSEQDATDYLDTLFNDILVQAIRPRERIRNMELLRRLANVLLDEAPVVLNAAGLIRRLDAGCTIPTMQHYVELLKRAYLFVGIHKYDTKSTSRRNSEKLYPIDVALMHARKDAFSKANLGWRLETVVLLELFRRYRRTSYDIYYYQDASGEVDFVVCQGCNVLALYQVCYSLAEPKVRKREVNTLFRVGAKLKCPNLTIISAFDEEVIEKNGQTIQVCLASDWFVTLPKAEGASEGREA